MDFNEKQKEIIYNENKENMLVAAAAGSGKTRVLVERIIKLISDKSKKISLDKFLIMTFTKKATFEMRSRIKDALDKKLVEMQFDEELIKESSLIQNANISTIDSFCMKVLEENYQSLDESNSLFGNFDPNYRIADSKELSVLYDDILTELLEDTYGKDEYKNLFNSYIDKSNDSTLRAMLLSGLFFLISIPWPDEYLDNKIMHFAEDSNKIYDDFITTKEKQLDDIKSKVPKFLEDLDDYIKILESAITSYENEEKGEKNKKKCEDCKNILNNKLKTFLNNFKTKNIDKNSVDELIKEYNDIDKVEYPTCKQALYDKDQYAVYRDNIKDILGTFNCLNELQEYYEMPDLIKVNENELLFLKLLKEFYLRVCKEKKKRNIYDISDYASLTLDILYRKEVDDDGNVKRVISDTALEIGKNFEYIFIDEYQDTNYIQEKIVEAISNGFTSPKVFMVGDIKQSIYGFRRAEPKIFAEKYKKYDEDKTLGHLVTLDLNYRSRKEILKYVNDLFSKIMLPDYGMIDYEKTGKLGIPEDTEKKETTPDTKVEIKVIVKKEKDEETEEGDDGNDNDENNTSIEGEKQEEKESTAADAAENTDDNKNLEVEEEKDETTSLELEADYVAHKIKELHDNKQFNYRDIVILLRSTKSKADVFMNALLKLNIPAYSEQKKGFFNRKEIMLMMDILNIIDNPFQNIPFASVLSSNIFSFSNEELAFIKIYNGNFSDYFIYDVLKKIKTAIDAVEKENENTDSKTEESNVEDRVEETTTDEKKIELVNVEEECKKYNINYSELKNKVTNFLDLYEKIVFKARFLSISELINLIYEKLNIKTIFRAEKDGNLRIANLDILYATARSYENSSYVGLFNFLRYVEKLRQLEDDQGQAKLFDENDNVVNIMTIHSSKGLEFKCVFLCSTGSVFRLEDVNKNVTLLSDKDVGIALNYTDNVLGYRYSTPKKRLIAESKEDKVKQEECRMLYVALTRAKEKLFITGTIASKGKNYSAKKFSEDYTDLGIARTNEERLEIVRNAKSYLELIMKSYTKDTDYATFEKVEWEIETPEDIIDKNDLDLTCDNADVDSFTNMIDDTYNYKLMQRIPAKLSVTEIKEEANNAKFRKFIKKHRYEDETIEIDIEDNKKRVDGTAIGNAYHRFMQFYDYEKNEYSCVNEKVDDNTPTNIVDISKIDKFKNSIIGKKMIDAFMNKSLFREYKFMKLFTPKEIYSYLQKAKETADTDIEKKILESKNVIIQGIIDAFLIEKDENGEEYIVLLDYKTDSLNNLIEKGKINEDKVRDKLISDYSIQLDIYKKVLEDLTGLCVRQKYIYSFALDEAIEL